MMAFHRKQGSHRKSCHSPKAGDAASYRMNFIPSKEISIEPSASVEYSCERCHLGFASQGERGKPPLCDTTEPEGSSGEYGIRPYKSV